MYVRTLPGKKWGSCTFVHCLVKKGGRVRSYKASPDKKGRRDRPYKASPDKKGRRERPYKASPDEKGRRERLYKAFPDKKEDLNVYKSPLLALICDPCLVL